MITLPFDRGIASRNAVMIQPTAGSSPAANVPTPQPHATQVAKMTTARMMAIRGTGDCPYWKLPIMA
jgi:hypothetical protein